MKPFARADRVSILIRQTLSDILRKSVKDPRLEMATITGVQMSRDLKNAHIYFAVSGGKKEQQDAMDGFQSALGYLKRTLGGELELRYMPELKFHYDKSFDYGARIEDVFRSINSDDGTDYTPPETD